MITTSADSVYQANPEMSPYESWQTAYGVHQPRIENLRNQEQAYSNDVQSIYDYLGNQGIESTGDPNDPRKMNLKRKRDKQFTDEQLATWIGDNQKGMGVDQKSLMRFLTDELGIENPLQYITGEDPIIKPGTEKAPGAALPDSTMSKSGRPMSRGADGKYYYDD